MNQFMLIKMRRLILATFYTLILFCSSLLLSSSAFAAEFSTSYDVTYKVNQSGMTTVSHTISLTNLKSDLYAKQYSILIGSEKIENPQGFDSLGELKLDFSKRIGETEIKAIFNEKVVGKGKTLTFILSYDTSEIATQQGRIWEINIPAPVKDETISSYKITLSVPPSFGKPAYLKPKPAHGLTWTLNEISSPISVAFGDFQSFDFDLQYHLKNNSLTPHQYLIPLPPDTLNQEVILKTLSPLPKNVIVDENENWLANYQLLPQQALQVSATGSAFIFLEKRPGFSILNQTGSGKCLSRQEFWEKDDPEIMKLAKELKTPRRIYDYVVETLTYDLNRVSKESQRLGARKILKDPKRATCMEFTDLFIALCRAAGIPAREINGFGFSNNPTLRPLSLIEDVLHAWPEYFDREKQIWVPVDPTWEKTTKGIDFFDAWDFNHLTFVIHGVSSETPVPPGAYKIFGDQRKNVNITFSKATPVNSKGNPELIVRFPERVLSGIPIKGEIKIRNPSPQALYNLSLEVLSSELAPKRQELNLPILPPFGHESFVLNFPCQNFFAWGENRFVIKTQGVEKQQSVKIQPLVVVFLPHLLGFSSFLTMLSFGILLLKKRWKRS